MPLLRPGLRRAAVALTAGLVLTGCSGGSAEPPSSATTTGTSAAAAGGTAPSPTATTPTAATPQPAPAEPTPLVAERLRTTEDGNVAAVAPLTLRRSGELVALEVLVRNVTPEGKGTDDFNTAFLFLAGSARFTGVSLVDTTNRKRHVVAEDVEGGCLCTSFASGLVVGRGGSAVVEAYFAAPPAGVTAMDVEINKIGTFTAVPLS